MAQRRQSGSKHPRRQWRHNVRISQNAAHYVGSWMEENGNAGKMNRKISTAEQHVKLTLVEVVDTAAVRTNWGWESCSAANDVGSWGDLVLSLGRFSLRQSAPMQPTLR